MKNALACDVAICGVDNNPARVIASRRFQGLGVPVIFSAVSAEADHGYVFLQEADGPCPRGRACRGRLEEGGALLARVRDPTRDGQLSVSLRARSVSVVDVGL
jgi:hypothetical protein